jgi:hypothetical protein
MIRTPTSLGSGFVAGPGGRIVTNLHVLMAGHPVTIVLPDSHEIKEFEVLATDEIRDLAVLRASPLSVPPLRLGDSDAALPGERVVAIGHPLGLDHTVSDGLLSGVRKVNADLALLQISAPISPGSSGGPVFNERGEVIGVATLASFRGNLNFCVPIGAVRPLLEAEQGTPIASWKPPKPRKERQSGASPLDLSALDGCTSAQLKLVNTKIVGAISEGAPLYNQGHYEACYRIYDSVSREIQRQVGSCAGVASALDNGAKRADSVSAFSAKAWAMRDAFDSIVDVMARRAGVDDTKLTSSVSRRVPHHPVELLSDCSKEAVEKLRSSIVNSINVGAPMYNDGQVDACVSIYETTVRALEKSVVGCRGARDALDAGMRQAKERPRAADKAWAYRDAFDGLLDVISRRASLVTPQPVGSSVTH